MHSPFFRSLVTLVGGISLLRGLCEGKKITESFVAKEMPMMALYLKSHLQTIANHYIVIWTCK